MAADPRILIVRLSHLGDVLHALPVYHGVRAAFPRARMGWVVQPEFADLLEGLPGLELVVPFDRRGGAAAWPRLHGRLGAFAASWTIDCQGNFKSALATLASGAPRRSGLARTDWREPAWWAATERAQPAGAGAHAVDKMLRLRELVAPGAAGPARFDLGLSEEERARGAALLDAGLPRTRERAAPVLLHLAPERDVRSWPVARWVELARLLAADGRAVLCLSGPAEEREGRIVREACARSAAVGHLVGQRGLRHLAALFAAAAERGATLVGCDSGPAHLATAVGLPAVMLCGPQDPARTGPWPPPGPGSPHRVALHPGGPDCVPCRARTCAHVRGPICMSELPPEHVLAVLSGA